jgi:hypothetical protein
MPARKGRPPLAEHDSDREDREPDERDVPFDEDAAWAAIVAGYGQEPPDPPGSTPYKPVKDLALPETVLGPAPRPEAPAGAGTAEEREPPAEPEPPASSASPAPSESSEPSEPSEEPPAAAAPLGSSVRFAPGVGPRDYTAPEPSDDDFDEDDEGHFVPPEPPPLPSGDTTARFAWLGVLGGPVLLLLAVLFGWEMTWWLTTLGVGGFLGGFGTLVARLRPDDEDDDPGRGAVV